MREGKAAVSQAGVSREPNVPLRVKANVSIIARILVKTSLHVEGASIVDFRAINDAVAPAGRTFGARFAQRPLFDDRDDRDPRKHVNARNYRDDNFVLSGLSHHRARARAHLCMCVCIKIFT